MQKELDRVGYFLGRLVITLAVIMGATLLWLNWGEHSLGHFVAILMFSVALAVAAVPAVITSYSIHYTKLYEFSPGFLVTCTVTAGYSPAFFPASPCHT